MFVATRMAPGIIRSLLAFSKTSSMLAICIQAASEEVECGRHNTGVHCKKEISRRVAWRSCSDFCAYPISLHKAPRATVQSTFCCIKVTECMVSVQRMSEGEGYWQRAEASALQEGSDHHEVVVGVLSPSTRRAVASNCSPRSCRGLLHVCSMIT